MTSRYFCAAPVLKTTTVSSSPTYPSRTARCNTSRHTAVSGHNERPVFRFLGALDETHRGKKAQAKYLLTSSANVIRRHYKLPIGKPMATLPVERLLGIVHDHRFESQTAGRAAGDEDVKSHYRKGTAGDWRNHFTPEHVAAFKQRHNELLIRLGYETGSDWDL